MAGSPPAAPLPIIECMSPTTKATAGPSRRPRSLGAAAGAPPAADTLRRVTVTAPPLFGTAIAGRRVVREPTEPTEPRVDREPVRWPLLLAVLLLAALAVAVAPAGAVVP